MCHVCRKGSWKEPYTFTYLWLPIMKTQYVLKWDKQSRYNVQIQVSYRAITNETTFLSCYSFCNTLSCFSQITITRYNFQIEVCYCASSNSNTKFWLPSCYSFCTALTSLSLRQKVNANSRLSGSPKALPGLNSLVSFYYISSQERLTITSES